MLLLAGQLVRAVAQLVAVVVLSRLLEPSIFGIAAAATVVVGLGELLRDAGLSTAALRAPSMTDMERSGLFWMNTLLGWTSSFILIGSAPLVSAMFGGLLPVSVICVLAVVFLVNGFAAQYRTDLLRTMKFRPVAIADAMGAVVGLVVAIGLALANFGLWALIAQIVASHAVSTLLVIATGRWRPSGVSSVRFATKYLKFGAGMTASQILGYIGNNVDVLALSARANPIATGIYNRGFQIVMAPTAMAQLPIQNSLVPALGRSIEEGVGYEQLVHRAQLAVGVIILPIPAVVAATSPGLVPLALGPGWSEAVGVVWLLAAGAAFQILASVASWIMISQGHGMRLASFSLVSLVVKATIIFPMASGGPRSVALGYAISMVILWPVAILWATFRTATRPLKVFARSSALLVLYGVAASTVFVSDRFQSHVVSIGLGVAMTAVVFGAAFLAPSVRGVVSSLFRRA